jgi:hypothetical protein
MATPGWSRSRRNLKRLEISAPAIATPIARACLSELSSGRRQPGRLNEILRAFQLAQPERFVKVLGAGDAAVSSGLLAHTAQSPTEELTISARPPTPPSI